ncbi:MAG: hypothetical protein WAN65_20825, partial [Candidatus Sulfotelmatobacter sp.]
MDLTAQVIVQQAFRLTGQMGAPGRGLSTEELAEGLQFLNQLLDSWNIMRNALYTVLDQVFDLTSNVQTYQIGLNAPAPFNVPRPNFISNADIIFQSSPIVRLPLTLISQERWSQIRVPQIFSLPTELYYDRGYSQTSPTGVATLNFWPGPDNSNTYQVELWTPVSLPTTLAAGTTLFAPPGYSRAVTYALAAELLSLYPIFGKKVDPEQEARIMRIAAESRKYVNNLNSPTLRMEIDP